MQTTAVYDAASETFDIHSPTTLSQKYWITNSAVHAQWSVVFAHLHVGQVIAFVFAFVVCWPAAARLARCRSHPA